MKQTYEAPEAHILELDTQAVVMVQASRGDEYGYPVNLNG